MPTVGVVGCQDLKGRFSSENAYQEGKEGNDIQSNCIRDSSTAGGRPGEKSMRKKGGHERLETKKKKRKTISRGDGLEDEEGKTIHQIGEEKKNHR